MSVNMHFEDDYFPAAPQSGLQVLIQEQMSRAPWWLLSVMVHLIFGTAFSLMAFSKFEPEPEAKFASTIEQALPEEIEEKIEKAPFEEARDIPCEMPSIEEPVISDDPLDDHNETDSNQDYEAAQGDPDSISNIPMVGKFTNATIGVGGGRGGAFGGRYGGKRRCRAGGATRKTESAVYSALIWLKNHQNPDGMWSTDKFMANCKGGACGGRGSSAEYDMGNTGLALLAYLGAGHTHNTGKFQRTVKAGLMAVKDRQLPNGCFGQQGGDGHWIYNHLITTMAVAEAYGLSRRSPMIESMAQKAVDYVLECQNPHFGWRYGCRPGDNDTSCTGWAVLALKSAKLSGLTVPTEAFDGAANWIEKVTDESYYKTGYTTKGDAGARLATVKNSRPLEAMTAAALASRIFMGETLRSPKVMGAANLLKNCPPKWNVSEGTVDMYYWYYGALAMWQIGGSHWTTWNDALKTALVPTQHSTGCLAGSWDPVCAWGEAGGRVYSTAINALTLEIYYRYAKVLNKK